MTAPTHQRIDALRRASWDDADALRWAARHWAARIGVRTRQIHLRQMRTKWASMSAGGRLTLNTELLLVPRALGEYVIVHELVHLLAPNHGKVYKSFLDAYLPDWRERDAALRVWAASPSPERRGEPEGEPGSPSRVGRGLGGG
jgi:hypothetical protein